MTVAELIEELNKVENKELDVVLADKDCDCFLVDEVLKAKAWYTKENNSGVQECIVITS